MDTCDAKCVPDDGSPVISCVRNGFHVVHRAADGTSFTWTPLGVYVKPPPA